MPNLTLMAYDPETGEWCESSSVEAGAQVNAWVASPSKFHVHKNSAGVQDIASGLNTKITFATDSANGAYNIGDNFDLANDKYIADGNQYMSFKWNIRFNETLNDGKLILAGIYLNGVIYKWGPIVSVGITTFAGAGGNVDIYLADEDQVEFYVYHNHGANRELMDLPVAVYFAGHRI